MYGHGAEIVVEDNPFARVLHGGPCVEVLMGEVEVRNLGGTDRTRSLEELGRWEVLASAVVSDTSPMRLRS